MFNEKVMQVAWFGQYLYKPFDALDLGSQIIMDCAGVKTHCIVGGDTLTATVIVEAD